MKKKNPKVNLRQETKVIVAMSGGVDSSVAAALLKKQSYEVAGVFMRFWAEPTADNQQPTANENRCCSKEAEQAARLVAAKLKIPFYVFNFEKEFKKEVVDYFLKEEQRGRTPNPCVVCNKKIKFGVMLEKALKVGTDFVATGHYARLRREFSIFNFQFPIKSQNSNAKKMIKLFCAKDKEKDQSYFLHTLTQKQLSHVLFPLGDYTKDEVYQLAKKWHLPYRQEESFDLCFVANDAESFIKKHLKLKPGRIADLEGKILGEHQGLALYTIGQRKRLPLRSGPWWVVGKNERKNILYVSNNERDLYSRELSVEKLNWLGNQTPKLPMKVWAKIRYKSEASEATLRQARGKNQLKLIFKKPQRAITPGQSVVFYTKVGKVLGGGVIKV